VVTFSPQFKTISLKRFYNEYSVSKTSSSYTNAEQRVDAITPINRGFRSEQ
jgi:hypothetical protein